MSGYRPDNGFDGLMAKVRQELSEASGKPKPATTPKPAPQNMKTVEEPQLEAEDVGMEDYSEEDLNATPAKPAPKSKSKDDKRYAVREVPDKEVQNPVPAKESKDGFLLLCNNCFKTTRNTEEICTECRSNMVERIVESDPTEIYGTTDKGPDKKAYKCPKYRTEEIANVVLHALQDFGGYWHTETVPSAAGTHYEFISGEHPKVKVYIEKSDPELPKED